MTLTNYSGGVAFANRAEIEPVRRDRRGRVPGRPAAEVAAPAHFT